MNEEQPGPDQSLVQLWRDSVIVLHVKKGGRKMLLEYRALAFLLSIMENGLYQCLMNFVGSWEMEEQCPRGGCWLDY